MHDQRLKDIVPFVASIEGGSFAAAAERLHVTGSAISKKRESAGGAAGLNVAGADNPTPETDRRRACVLPDLYSHNGRAGGGGIGTGGATQYSVRAAAAGRAEYLWQAVCHAVIDYVLPAASGDRYQHDLF